MAGITQFDEKTFQNFINDLIIQNNDLKNIFVVEDGDVSSDDLKSLANLFMYENIVDAIRYNQNNPFFLEYPNAALYSQNMRGHIYIGSIFVEIIKIIFSESVFRFLYFEITKTPLEIPTKAECLVVIQKIKNIITSNVINLKGCCLCVYMQFITHLKEHQSVGFSEIIEWMRSNENKCTWIEFIHECQWYNEKQCFIVEKNGLQMALDSLCGMNVLKCISERTISDDLKEYKIRF